MDNTIKGLKEFLEDDKSLTEELTYEEFQEKKAAPGNSDDGIGDAYEAYCRALEKI